MNGWKSFALFLFVQTSCHCHWQLGFSDVHFRAFLFDLCQSLGAWFVHLNIFCTHRAQELPANDTTPTHVTESIGLYFFTPPLSAETIGSVCVMLLLFTCGVLCVFFCFCCFNDTCKIDAFAQCNRCRCPVPMDAVGVRNKVWHGCLFSRSQLCTRVS